MAALVCKILQLFCNTTVSLHISCIEIYNNTHLTAFCWVAWEKKETRGNGWCWLFPVDWGVSEKLIIFLVARRGSKGRKMPRGHWYLSIYLSLFLPRHWIYLCISPMSCLILSGRSSYSCVQPRSDCFLALLSSHLASFFFSSPPPVLLSYLTGLWASLSISRISYSYHSRAFIPSSSHLPFVLAFLSACLDGYSMRYAMGISHGIRVV